MSHPEVAGEMEAWPTARFRQWITSLTEDSAPRSINWWLSARWIAQLNVYDRTLPTEARREWADVALLLIECAERFSGYDRSNAAVDTFNLRCLVINELGPVPRDAKWDPVALARDVLAAVTMPPHEAHQMAEHWQTLPLEQVRLLRRHKNLLGSLVAVVDQLPAGSDADDARRWLAVLPDLP